MIDLYNGDCLEVMDSLIKKGVKVDAIITDPPYGTTDCKWDSVIPFSEMWPRLNALIKDNGAVVLFGSEPFSSALRMSNIKNYKYDWVWEKSTVSNFFNAKNAPLKKIENICVFSNGNTANCCKNRMVYNPQGLKEINKKKINSKRLNSSTITERPSRQGEYVQKYSNYPINILKFQNPKKTVHPTQKPVELMEYLIKTYTQEGETVLDFTMGSGSTGCACVNTNRDFIGIELDENYFKIAQRRINDELAQGKLF